MIWPLLAIVTLLVCLIVTAPLIKGGQYSKGLITLFFASFIAASLGTYALIGRPDLLKDGALQPYTPPTGPTQAQMQAAQEMTPEDRAEMIIAMVDSLAAKLEDNPADPQGWARLIRARTVLGQTERLEADKARVREIFKDDPSTLNLILDAEN